MYTKVDCCRCAVCSSQHKKVCLAPYHLKLPPGVFQGILKINFGMRGHAARSAHQQPPISGNTVQKSTFWVEFAIQTIREKKTTYGPQMANNCNAVKVSLSLSSFPMGGWCVFSKLPQIPNLEILTQDKTRHSLSCSWCFEILDLGHFLFGMLSNAQS